MSERVVQEAAELPPAAPQAVNEPHRRRSASSPATGDGFVPAMYGGGDRQAATKATADAALRTPTTSVPFQDDLQPQLPNIDLKSITAHVGPEAGAHANQMGANAFAAGDHIVLPDNASKHTVAHEIAHVVQQRTGIAVPGGVGRAGDEHEQAADQMADELVAGKLLDVSAPKQAITSAVQMESKDESYEPTERLRQKARNEFENDWDKTRDKEEQKNPAAANDPFGGGHGKQTSVEDGKTVGQGGFGQRLIGESTAQAQAKADEWGDIAVPVQQSTEELDKGFEEQQHFIEENHASKGHWASIGDDPIWVQKEKAYANGWAQENMASIGRYKYEQSRFTTAYSSWVPLANTSHMAAAELVECADIMGFNVAKPGDAVRFVQGLEMSLDMARDLVSTNVLGPDKQTSYKTIGDDPAARSNTTLALGGESVSPHLPELKAAYRELQTANDGIYLGLLDDRKAALDQEKGHVTGEITEINEVIEFWANLAETSQSAYKKSKPIVDGTVASKLDKKFANGDHEAKKNYKAAGKAAVQAGKDKAKDPNNDDKEWESQARMQDFRNHNETWGGAPAEIKDEESAAGGAEGGHTEAPEVPDGEGGAPELSLGGIVKAGLTMFNAKKLDDLARKLDVIENTKGATDATIKLVKTRNAIKVLEGAKKKFDEQLAKVGTTTMQAREQEMVALGGNLDKYAVEHRDDLQKLHKDGLVPPEHHELYATMMACVAKVEKLTVVSKLAIDAFPFNELVHTFNGMQNERNGRVHPQESATRDYNQTGHPPPRLPFLNGAEEDVYQHMTGTYMKVMQQDQHWAVRLEGVTERFGQLMKDLEGGHKNTVGKAF